LEAAVLVSSRPPCPAPRVASPALHSAVWLILNEIWKSKMEIPVNTPELFSRS
jgi:hypothetical protein